MKAKLRCLQRFIPSEFGHDIDRADPEEPGLTMYRGKREVRRCIEGAGIPYTYICCNSIAAWPYHDNTHPADVLPPLDRFKIYGDGTVKGTLFTVFCFLACREIILVTIFFFLSEKILYITPHIP